MNKPILVERYADNGTFSHWALIQEKTGELLWSEAPEEETQEVKNCSIPDVGGSYIVFEDGYEEGIEGMIQLTNKLNTLEDAQRYAKGCKQNTYIAKMVE